MTEHTITIDAARLLLLSMQGLANPPARPAVKADVLDAIRRMGALQIDTIHVVARSPYLVLFSRLGSYEPVWLDELLADGQLFEYWSHAASFLPIEDYPLYVSRMPVLIERYYSAERRAALQPSIDQVMQAIHANGPVRSADFERSDKRRAGWWDWKEEKQALEYLHTRGHLMISRRDRFQRVYDLRERVQPGWDDTRALPLEEAQDELAVRAVRVLGAAPARWVPDYFRLPKLGMPKRLERLANSGRLERVSVEGWQEPWYIHVDTLPALDAVLQGQVRPTYTALLSPFDPLIWDRERVRTLFNFDYVLECYLPETKRRYGYFTLAILSAGALIGRLDAKAYRKEGIFEVRALYLEPGVEPTEETACTVAEALHRCANWHATPRVEIRGSEPEIFAQRVEHALAAIPADGKSHP